MKRQRQEEQAAHLREQAEKATRREREKKDAERPKMLTFKTTYLSDVGIRTLGNHALGLPKGDPARETIRLLIERWVKQGREVKFPTTGPDTRLNVDPYAGLEDVMKEAA